MSSSFFQRWFAEKQRYKWRCNVVLLYWARVWERSGTSVNLYIYIAILISSRTKFERQITRETLTTPYLSLSLNCTHDNKQTWLIKWNIARARSNREDNTNTAKSNKWKKNIMKNNKKNKNNNTAKKNCFFLKQQLRTRAIYKERQPAETRQVIICFSWHDSGYKKVAII